MKLPRIGSITTYLEGWYERHIGLALILYSIVVLLVLFFVAVAFLFNEYYSFGSRSIAFYFYFWLVFYGFSAIMDDWNNREVKKIVDKEKTIAKQEQTRRIARALRRSREMTVPREKRA